MTFFRAVLQAMMLWCGVLLQASFVSSLGDPWAAFPVLLVWGIVLLHEQSLVWGVWWLTFAGLLLEVRGLGFGLTVAYAGAAAVTALLVTSVFAKRSLAGLLGVSAVSVTTFLFLRLGSVVVWNMWHAEPWYLGLRAQNLLFVLVAVPLSVGLLSFIRRRLFRFSYYRPIRRSDPL